ncbi:MAG TPA: protein-L-isoaspartate(D-aspartate) O-methyltransferase [Myxococcota bacterium]|nr:protein-L-isoaspartate(D-aspartate) O-methyltransferase [Myxococcota bacterium]
MSSVDFADRRAQMVTLQLEARGVRDPRVLAAMREVPRHLFVSAEQVDLAYEDCALPIGEGQTISQPYVVAWMLEALALRADERALEVGAGSGYAAAILSRLARAVFAIERDPALVDAARRRLAAIGAANVELAAGDGSLGWPERAPFDAILVSAAAPRVPPALLEQLAAEGRLVGPVRSPQGDQSLLRIERRADGGLDTRDLGAVQFVPLV